MGAPGIETVRRILPGLKTERSIDLVIAQAENVTDGKGLSVADFNTLQQIGVDFFTGGNWSTHLAELHPYLSDPDKPVIRPANYLSDTPGLGWKYIQTSLGKAQVISLLGHIVGRDAEKPVDNPLHIVDTILAETMHESVAARIVNFHGDYSSEKKVIGYYLDGRVTAVIGDHWHIPTADAMVLPKGTAHITDVGMCGTLHSSLGVRLGIITKRWHDNIKSKNQLETAGPLQFNAVLIDTDPQTGVAASIQPIQKTIN